jgi:GNAT superfamily N-acetyltransferase
VTVRVRRREADDLPALVEVLGEQQPSSSYPLRWPLPFPVEQFLVRPGERAAWVAETDGRVVGHVAVGDLDDGLGPVFAEAVGGTDLALLAVLFVGLDTVGQGVGALLHDAAVSWIRGEGKMPVLDVVPTHARAVEFYRRRGWREVGRLRPGWLPADRPALTLMALDD